MVKNADPGVWEIKVDGKHNECLVFAPLQRRIRGEFDLNRETEPMAQLLRNQWANPLPGQVIGVDPINRVGYIYDAVAEHAPSRAKIEAKGWAVPPVREEFLDIDVATWVHHMAAAIDGGLAHTVKGVKPVVEGKPRLSFHTTPAESDSDRLADAINRLAAKAG